jgi:putative spermidine/putrescine transport system permease protein
MKRQPFFYWFTVPAVFLALAFLASMGAIIQYSFRKYIPGSLDVGPVTLANFERLGHPLYFNVYLDTLLLSLYTSVFTLLLGYPLAYVLVRARSTWVKSTVLIVSIVPLFTGEIVRTYAWLNVLGNNGFLNSLLLGSGLIERPIQMMFTPFGVTVALVHFSMPIMVVILAAAISHIDTAYEKAAASLRANPLKVFWKITLPLSTPGIVSGFVTIFAWTLSAFATPQLIGGGKVNMVSNVVYQLGFASFNFPFAAVLSLLAVVLTIALLLVIHASTRRVEEMSLH